MRPRIELQIEAELAHKRTAYGRIRTPIAFVTFQSASK